MRKLLLLLAFVVCANTFGQETSSIQGNILDAELYNEPLLMATVTIKNSTLSTHTNFRGNFEFNDIAPGTYNIIVQYLGYETIELPITVGSGTTSNIQASLKAKTLDFGNLTAEKPSSK